MQASSAEFDVRLKKTKKLGQILVEEGLITPQQLEQALHQQSRDDQPLGRILIRHNVLRRIEPTAFVRVVPGPTMMQWFGLDQPTPTYGRLAYIHCDEQPAVELLEIVAPE